MSLILLYQPAVWNIFVIVKSVAIVSMILVIKKKKTGICGFLKIS